MMVEKRGIFRSLVGIALAVIVVSLTVPHWAAANGSSTYTLVMKQNSQTMLLNGERVQAAQPVTFKNDTNYVPLSSMARLYDFKVSFDSKSKEVVARNGEKEIRFNINSSSITVNGERAKLSSPLFLQEGYLMVPLRTWANLTNSTLTVNGTEFTFIWSTAPKADFIILPNEIYATQTVVSYEDRSSAYGGRQIIDEQWEGKADSFDEAGTYVITSRVQDDTGIWSEPYQVKIEVRPPNQPPVAHFKTDKDEYRLGEPIQYIDMSYDDEDRIIRRTWTGKEPAYFAAGEYEITLEVEDHLGLVDSISKKITVTEEVLYTEDEFYRVFTPIGEKFLIDGSTVLDIPSVPFHIQSDQMKLIRSNSPEQLLGDEGIAYEDTLSGNFRLAIHNQNRSNKNLVIYLLATNRHQESVSLEVQNVGMAGPTTYVSASGKTAVSRILSSFQNQKQLRKMTIPAGESRIILPELNRSPLKPGLTMTAYADIFAEKDLLFSIVALDPSKNAAIEAFPQLDYLERDGKHVRGTFIGANRSLHVSDQSLLGTEPQRIVIGDRNVDPPITGYDPISKIQEENTGNRGVLYTLKLHVAPQTVITLNPRGGHYGGAFMVNGEMIHMTKNSILQGQGEAGVLYRTGVDPEEVGISFVIASGSNLPLNLLFLPLPERRP